MTLFSLARTGRRRRWLLSALAAGLVATTWSLQPAAAAEGGRIKVGVLKFGTVNWELDTVERNGFDSARGFDLEILPLAGKNATSVALQAGEVDMIVTDWLWVTRQRAEGAGFTFIPYSTGLGALMVPADSQIKSLADLAGRRVGIAGGPVDKSWLLFRALAARRDGRDLADGVEPVFGAPPLLNEQILAGRIDAVINFWPYCARLEAAGLTRLLEVEDVVKALGIESRVPLIGYVFDQAWADEHQHDVLAFQQALQDARRLLAESDQAWEALRPLMKAGDEATFLALRAGYRRGIPRRWGEAERGDAARLFEVLAGIGGKELVGSALSLQDGTFWPAVSF